MLKRIRDRLDGALNPVMVKRMYQSVHSKVSMAFFWLLLALALLIFYLSGGGGEGAAGRGMFTGFAVLMAPMVWFIIPTAAFYGLYQDIRTRRTLELIQITTMGARQLVRGRMLAAAVRIVLLCALVGPFAVTSFLFGGVDLVFVLTAVCYLVLTAFSLTALALFLGSLAAYPKIRLLGVLAFGAMMLFGLLGLLGWVPGIYMLSGGGWPGFPGAGAGLSAFLAAIVVLTVLWIAFLSAATANSLTFPQNRSSARTKLIALLIAACYLGTMLLTARGPGSGSGAPMVFALICCPFIGACALFWITGDTRVPARHAAWLARHGRAARVLYFPFRDGPLSTVLYLLLALALIGIGIASLRGPGHLIMASDRRAFHVIVFTFTCVLYLSALARGAVALLPGRMRTALNRRTVLVALLILNAVLLFGISGPSRSFPRTLATSATAFLPSVYAVSLMGGAPSGRFLSHMAGPFAVGFLYYAGLAFWQWRTASRRRAEAGQMPSQLGKDDVGANQP
jgi:hypothetical protein